MSRPRVRDHELFIDGHQPQPPFWAKHNGDRIHPLTAHSADVAAVVHTLLADHGTLIHRLARLSGFPDRPNDLRRILVYLAAIHDLGKANLSFQDQPVRGRTPEPGRRRSRGHVKVVIASLVSRYRPLEAALSDVIEPFAADPRAGTSALLTALCHHGRPWDITPEPLPRTVLDQIWGDQPATRRSPIGEIRRLGCLAARWSGVESVPDAHAFWTAPLSHVFAGVLTAADWIGSTAAAFPFAPTAEADLDAYWELACGRARQVCLEVGVLPRQLDRATISAHVLENLFPDIFPRFPPSLLQRTVEEMELPRPGSKLLFESETGSGKTEAVLALYARMRAAGLVDGLVFALPTRATSSAMFQRVARAISQLYPAGEQPQAVLAIGGGGLGMNGPTGVGLPEDTTQYPDPNEIPLSCWATEHSKRFLAGEIVVGTIDQVLLAGLPVRHAHLRLGLLMRHLIVVDEVHSHDRYMTVVLANLLGLHAESGGTSVLLSATLSQRERRRFAGPTARAPTFEHAVLEPYPTMLQLPLGQDEWQEIGNQDGGSATRDRRFRWETTDLDAALSRAILAAEGGARVCILRNTVSDAVATNELLRKECPDLLWRPFSDCPPPTLHSRFTPADRRVLDDAVLRSFGPTSARRPEPGSIVVSTQVIEQSLDVDFDLLVTDLAPVDVLIQRMGRVHRHRFRERPPDCAEPAALIVAPQDGFASELNRRLPHGWGHIYRDLMDLELTLRVIRQVPAPTLPRQGRLLIESVYHESCRTALESEVGWEAYALRREGEEAGQESHARKTHLDFHTDYPASAQRFLRDHEGAIRTRLGDASLVVELPSPVEAAFARGELCNIVSIPIWAFGDQELHFEQDVIPVEAEETSEATYIVAGVLRISYSDQGWTWKRQ